MKTSQAQKNKAFVETCAVSKRLYAAATLPQNVLPWTVSESTCFLFENAEHTEPKIRIVNFKAEGLFNPPSRAERRMISELGTEALKRLVQRAPTAAPEKLVSAAEISKTDWKIDPDFYIFDSAHQADIERIHSFSRTLSDIAEIIRPATLRGAVDNPRDGHIFREASASDMTVEGELLQPKSETFVPTSKIKGTFLSTVLQPNDIVFAYKGAVGRCALVRGTPKEWIIGQSLLCLRLKPGIEGMSPKALLLYLNSPAFKSYLSTVTKSVSNDKKMSFMSAKDVEKFPIPMLSDAQIIKAESAVEKIESLVNKREQINAEIVAQGLSKIPDDWK